MQTYLTLNELRAKLGGRNRSIVLMSCTVMRLCCFRRGMLPPGPNQDRQNAVTAQAMTNRTKAPETVRDLAKSLSGNYQNACPGICESPDVCCVTRVTRPGRFRGLALVISGQTVRLAPRDQKMFRKSIATLLLASTSFAATARQV